MEKINQGHKRHGLDTVIDEKDLGENPALASRIREVGKTLTPFGNDYCGSFVVHLYKRGAVNANTELNFAPHIVTTDIPFSEPMSRTALQILALHVMRFFGNAKPSTRDSSDKRGKFPGDTFTEA